MELKDLYTAGSDILNSVTDAVEAGDFSNLAGDIQKRVNDLTNQVKSEVDKNRAKVVRSQGSDIYAAKRPSYRRRGTYFMPTSVSTAGAVVQIVFSSIGLSIFLPALCGALLMMDFFGGAMGAFILVVIMSIVSGLGLFGGIRKRKLIKAYKKYAEIIGDRDYVLMTELEECTGKSTKQIWKELRQLKKMGYIQNARIDDKVTTLMLTREVYNQYLETKKNQESLEKQQQAREKELDEALGDADDVKAILREGNAYLETIRDCNNEIPGEEVSSKLFRLENIMKKIFEQVEKNPESAKDLRKFMEYYLPTTTKLLRAYVDLEKQPEVDNIRKTKKEIESSLDVINDAFEQLLDDMFQDVAWDISSDISVMKTMMAQDGLVQTATSGGAMQASGGMAMQTMEEEQ
ncbi:MAG: hypothetical protein E7297_05620 [Lachnospiraceae bacterium]|jgi:5-bromo-4-chloroindolyl phosphate hydrolysis protein|nr:hypothetical protein [Lachnospiraceae bacterium]